MVSLIPTLSAGIWSTVGDWVAKFIAILYDGVGSYAVAVVLFTLILKAVLSPLDVWQKLSMRKNNKAMERMKPKLEKLQKQYGNNRELYSQKQMQLYKEEGYSMMGSCLPTIVTMLLFFMVFSGFRAAVKTVNVNMYTDMRAAYYTTYKEEVEVKGSASADAVAAAKAAVVEAYEADYADRVGFLWVENVFMPDSWKSPIPDYATFTGNKLGQVGAEDPYYNPQTDAFKGFDEQYDTASYTIVSGENGYNEVMQALVEEYNYNDKGKKAWNGYVLLPILAVLITIASSKLNKPAEPPMMPGQENSQAAMQANTKMMQYMMPVMMGVFALFYSTAFTIYMVISSLFTSAFQFIYNIVAKQKDIKEEEARLKTTFK